MWNTHDYIRNDEFCLTFNRTVPPFLLPNLNKSADLFQISVLYTLENVSHYVDIWKKRVEHQL